MMLLCPCDTPSMRFSLYGGPMDGATVSYSRVKDGKLRRGISEYRARNIRIEPDEPIVAWDWDDVVPDAYVTYTLTAKNTLQFSHMTRAL